MRVNDIRMTPEVAERWRETCRRHEKQSFPPPLPFEMPGSRLNRPLLGAIATLGDGWMDAHRLYAGNVGGLRRLLMMLWPVMAVFAPVFAFGAISHPSATLWLELSVWVWLLIIVVVGLWAYWYQFRVARTGCHIFDRDADKLYLYAAPDLPHQELEFYDQYFFVQESQMGHVRSGSLYIYVPEQEYYGRRVGGFPMRIAFTGSREEAMDVWYLLVRFMDKETPFIEKDFEFFDYLADRKRRYGYRIEGQRFPDGTVEWL